MQALCRGVQFVASRACPALRLAAAAHPFSCSPTCALQDERELLLWRGPPPETPPDYRYHVELPKFIPPTK